MDGGYNNLGIRMLENITTVVGDTIVPFMEMYRLPSILLGVAVFVVVWSLIGWILKGRA